MRKLSYLIILAIALALVTGCAGIQLTDGGVAINKQHYDTPKKLLAKAQMTLKGVYDGIAELDRERVVPISDTDIMLAYADDAYDFLKKAEDAYRLKKNIDGMSGNAWYEKADGILTWLAVKILKEKSGGE